MSDDWTEQELADEQTLLTLEPGTYVDDGELVFVCSADGVRAVVPKKTWDYIRDRFAKADT